MNKENVCAQIFIKTICTNTSGLSIVKNTSGTAHKERESIFFLFFITNAN